MLSFRRGGDNKVEEMFLKLQRAYHERGLSYAELEKISGIPKATIQRYVMGVSDKIDIDKLRAICDALEVDAAYVVGWADTPREKAQKEAAEIISRLPESAREEALRYLRYVEEHAGKE